MHAVSDSAGPSIGDPAPEIALFVHEFEHQAKRWRLSGRRGKGATVVIFHPLSFGAASTATLRAFDAQGEAFAALGAEVVMISVDHANTLFVWAGSANVRHVKLLSDFLPRGAVARAYGTLAETDLADRAIFVVDRDGAVRDVLRLPASSAADPQPTLAILRALASAETGA